MVNRYPEGGGGDHELEGRIDLLKGFLESTDFGRLRSQSEAYLAEGMNVKFVICSQEDDPDYRMVVVEGGQEGTGGSE